ncbi:VPS9 domain-containing protein 1 [Hyperolius riggenbachi]|uniref:VPS9 domain-containing protein 1 n=1 Tax=Hyperolius riggenbachi TaxID=752182 RepID=UPI0035A36B95
MASSGDGVLKPLQRAMKMASRGLQLDTGNRPQEAYVEYLKSVSFIAQVLAEEAELDEVSVCLSCDSQRMLKLAEQCLERAKTTADKLGKGNVERTPQNRRISEVPDPPPPSEGSSPASMTTSSHPSIARPWGHRRSYSEDFQKHGSFPSPEVFQMLLAAEAQSSKKELTPLEEASIQNQKLRAAYEVRLARLDPRQASQKTSLTLSLQRQMMENLVIAKAREETLKRKSEERRQRLQAESNRLFSRSETVTPSQKEHQSLHTDVLEYEQDNDWPKQHKMSIKNNPNDPALVSCYVNQVLSTSEHPVAKLVRKLQCQLYSLMYPIISIEPAPVSSPTCKFSHFSLPAEPSFSPTTVPSKLRSSKSLHCLSSLPRPSIQHSRSIGELGDNLELATSSQTDRAAERRDMESSFEDLEHLLSPTLASGPGTLNNLTPKQRLKMVVKEIHRARDKLISAFLLALDLPASSTVKDVCVAYLDENFFPPLWPALLALYRQMFFLREGNILHVMDSYSTATPVTLGVPLNLSPEDVKEPYKSAIQDLEQLPNQRSPNKKLECIVRILRVICQCAEEYYPTHGASAIGADDLLPILAFVVLKSRMCHLLSECAALEEFIPEGCLIAEEGYCLTSLQTAVAFVETLALPPPDPAV